MSCGVRFTAGPSWVVVVLLVEVMEGSLSGLERHPAKVLGGESRLVGSNPTLSARVVAQSVRASR